MSTRKTTNKPAKKPTRSTRTAHRAIRPSLASTLGAAAANQSVASPGRMSPLGDQPHTETPREPVDPARGKALPPPTTKSTRANRGRRRAADRN